MLTFASSVKLFGSGTPSHEEPKIFPEPTQRSLPRLGSSQATYETSNLCSPKISPLSPPCTYNIMVTLGYGFDFDGWVIIWKHDPEFFHFSHRIVLSILPPSSVFVLPVPYPLSSQRVGWVDIRLCRQASHLRELFKIFLCDLYPIFQKNINILHVVMVRMENLYESYMNRN